MAIIKCPECAKEISDKAKSCPQCGCPINEKNIVVE
ncbi:MAG: zinc-ribbon domain-containing protein [Clostridiales bacterium]|nr:zinc-ribbon domain-containing protein [Clostridiales bacterium]